MLSGAIWGHCKSWGLSFFFYGRGNENHRLGIGFFVSHRTVSAVKRVEFVSDRMSHIVLRVRWCNIIVLNVHAPSEEKSDDLNGGFFLGIRADFDVLLTVHFSIIFVINQLNAHYLVL